MKNLVLTIFICSLTLVSCNKENPEVNIVEKGEFKETELQFVLPKKNHSIDEDDELNFQDYVTDGYKIHISGAIHPSHKNFTEIDLMQTLIVKSNGAIVVTVVHPDFEPNELTTKSYYGIDEVDLLVNQEVLHEVEMDFVQGRVVVLAEENLDDSIEEVNILGKSAIFDVTYYTASEMIEVEIITKEGSFKNEHANMLGEETHYVLNSLEEGLLIEDY